jgi:hypothetical protein
MESPLDFIQLHHYEELMRSRQLLVNCTRYEEFIANSHLWKKCSDSAKWAVPKPNLYTAFTRMHHYSCEMYLEKDRDTSELNNKV